MTEDVGIHIYERARSSIAYISVHNKCGKEFPDLPSVERHGTGFIWDELGHCVTNFCTGSSNVNLKVRFNDSETVQEYSGTLVGSNPPRDVAVHRFSTDEVLPPPLQRQKSERLSVGQGVYAIGAPFGSTPTFTSGIINGLGREISTLVSRMPLFDVIQTGWYIP